MVAAVFRTIFAQPTSDMDLAKAEVLAFTGFPRLHWTKIWSINPL